MPTGKNAMLPSHDWFLLSIPDIPWSVEQTTLLFTPAERSLIAQAVHQEAVRLGIAPLPPPSATVTDIPRSSSDCVTQPKQPTDQRDQKRRPTKYVTQPVRKSLYEVTFFRRVQCSNKSVHLRFRRLVNWSTDKWHRFNAWILKSLGKFFGSVDDDHAWFSDRLGIVIRNTSIVRRRKNIDLVIVMRRKDARAELELNVNLLRTLLIDERRTPLNDDRRRNETKFSSLIAMNIHQSRGMSLLGIMHW
jgi:hypothetical protein